MKTASLVASVTGWQAVSGLTPRLDKVIQFIENVLSGRTEFEIAPGIWH